MPKDYISPSRKLSAWLDAQGIETKEHYTTCDLYSPVVVKAKLNPFDESGAPVYCDDSFEVSLRADSCDANYVCPFFGPGGSDNSLKALRGWAKKNGWRLTQTNSRAHSPTPLAWTLTRWDDKASKYMYATTPVWTYGKTDGIALHDLLYKVLKIGKNG